jgi:hypothetical protein
MRDKLIEAAKHVAEDPTDSNIANLLTIAFDFPFNEMPRAFLDAPAPGSWNVTGSIGDQLAELNDPRA